MKNPFSSTNIVDLLQAQIDVIAKVNDVLVSSKIDENTMKDIAKRVKPITDTIKSLVEIANEMATLKISSVIGNAKFSLLVDSLISNITVIGEKLSTTEVDPKITEKTKLLCDAVKNITEIAKSLGEIGKSALMLIIMKPAINAVLNLVISVAKKIDENSNVITKLNDNAKIIGEGIAVLAKGIAMFVLFTLGGLVPLVAIIALLSVKLFLSIFFLLFNETTVDKIKISLEAINEIAKTMLILSMTVLIWALTGLLIQEEWKNLLIVATFVLVAIGLFTLLGFLQQFIKNGTDSLLMIAKVFVIISLTVVLWALTGLLIKEEWENIAIVATFVLIAIGLFILLGFASKYIEQGSKEMIIIALTLVILSLTVVLWAATGDYVLSNFGAVIIMLVFVGITILMFVLLSKATKDIVMGGVALMLLSAALIILGFSVMLYVVAGQMLIDNLLAVGAVMIFLVLVIGICALLSATFSFIILGSAALEVLSVGLLIFSVALLLLVAVAKMLTLDDMLALVASIVALSGAVALIGVAMPLIVVGSIALGILGAALIVFMVPLLMFAAAVAIFKKVDANEEDVKRPISLMGVLITAINDTFGIKETLAMALAIPKIMMLVPIAAAIGLIAKIIQQIASLSVPIKFDSDGNGTEFVKMTGKDFTEAATNAAGMVSILANIFGEKPFTVDVAGEKINLNPISKSALEGITFSVAIKMKLLNSIVESIGNMAKVLSNVAALTVPDDEKGFDENGKPKGWRTMKKDDFKNACENISKIIITLLEGLTTYRSNSLGGKSVIEAVDDMSRSAIKKIKLVLESFSAINGIIDAIQAMVQMNIPTEWDENGKPTNYRIVTETERAQAIDNVICLMTELLKAMTSEELTESLDKMGRSARKNLEVIMNSCGGVNSLVNAIEKAASFNKDTIGNGIVNIKECILRYAGVINDLFVDKWGWTKKKISMFGKSFNIPWYTIVDKAEISMGNLRSAMDKMEKLTSTMDPLGNLVNGIKNLAEGDGMSIVTKGVSDLKKLVISYTQIFTGDDKGKGGVNITPVGEKKFARFKELVSYHDKFAKINTQDLTKNTDSFVKFIDKANSVDSNKIKSIRDMFEQMANFSKSVKGDFDKLADILSEKLVDILDKLNTTISDVVNSDVNTNTSNNSIFDKINNNTSGTEKEQKEQKEKDKQKQDLKGISDSIEEMLEVLKQIKDNTENQQYY